MRPRSSANSVEWYTFLRNILGWKRASEITINVPDIGVSLRMENPFEGLEVSRDIENADEDDDAALMRTMKAEQAVAGRIIEHCMTMLQNSPEWDNVVEAWSKDRIGLCWKRYDRLEWIFGSNERKMYGTIAMMKSHDLELRPKEHYPTRVLKHKRRKKAEDAGSSNTNNYHISAATSCIDEPNPVEGFLIRLTSQKGNTTRMGLTFYKRLYFSTFDQYLVFTRPAKSSPPPPPQLPSMTANQIPSSQEIADSIPLVYGVNPFPIDEHGEIEWLNCTGRRDAKTLETQRVRDEDAHDEEDRKAKIILECDGYIDLTQVVRVRPFKPQKSIAHTNNSTNENMPTDEHNTMDSPSMTSNPTIDDQPRQHGNDQDEAYISNPEADFDASVADTSRPDGATRTDTFDTARIFELVMKNGLVMQLQAYNIAAQKEWISRLQSLTRYWTLRKAADIATLKAVRAENLEKLGIDEEGEAYVGQFADKWEVHGSVASGALWNLCGINSCRTIAMSGTLFRKPRKHSSFTKCNVILSSGQLLIFQDVLRASSGKLVSHITHERIPSACLDLRDCYLYSGLLTEGELLYGNATFDADAARPGSRALPRCYREDGWMGRDEDVMCCFVIWSGKRKSWFRSEGDEEKALSVTDEHAMSREGEKDTNSGFTSRFKRVSSLGVPGKSVVFRTRSRAERDHWVLAIQREIERLEREEDFRLTGAGNA
jgi:hypothetical protein